MAQLVLGLCTLYLMVCVQTTVLWTKGKIFTIQKSKQRDNFYKNETTTGVETCAFQCDAEPLCAAITYKEDTNMCALYQPEMDCKITLSEDEQSLYLQVDEDSSELVSENRKGLLLLIPGQS